MAERGEPGTEELREMIGDGLDTQRDSDEKLKAIEEKFEVFLAKTTRKEAWEAALERRFMMFPVNSIEDMVASPIHTDRCFFSDQALEHNPAVLYPSRLIPGVPSRSRMRVESLGESTFEVLRQFGFDEASIEGLWRNGTI